MIETLLFGTARGGHNFTMSAKIYRYGIPKRID